MKKQGIAALLCLLLLALTPLAALAETAFAGEVTAGATAVISAPYGGIVSDVAVRAGDSVKLSDPIASVQTTKSYAMIEGTVTGVFASEGDSADGIAERYGAVLYIEPVNRFRIEASTARAYNSSENRYVHIGEIVYLVCTNDGSHKGRGIVTGLSETDDQAFTVEVTAGEFYMDEPVSIYRSADYDTKTRIGRGNVTRTQPVSVKGEGSVLRMHVRSGDRVERGELLFETVSGTLDGLYAPDTTVVSDVVGVVASVEAKNGVSVEKGATLATVYPLEAMQVQMVITEADLMDVHVGDAASIELNWNTDSARFEGVVSAISYTNIDGGAGDVGSAQYTAYVDFTPDDTVRIGMTAVVYVQ